MPLSPWGYWPQMSKMENLGDFSDFRLSAPRALFGIVPSGEAGSLATQGIAVVGKKSENLRPFGRSKRFSAVCSIPSYEDFVKLHQKGAASIICLLLLTDASVNRTYSRVASRLLRRQVHCRIHARPPLYRVLPEKRPPRRQSAVQTHASRSRRWPR